MGQRERSDVLLGRLREFLHAHHNVPIIEWDPRGSGEFESRPLGADFPDSEMDRSGTNLETQSEAHLPEPGICLLDPIFETIRAEGAHVPDKDELDKISDRLALFFRARMHLDHEQFSSRSGAGATGHDEDRHTTCLWKL
jgi:hypothetical protein